MSNQMKPYYIVVTPFFPTEESFRGPFILDQVKAIKRTGKYTVMVFKPKTWNEKLNNYVYEGVKVNLFTAFQMPSYLFNGMTNRMNCTLFVKQVQKLGIDVNNIAVVHGHTSTFGAYALALKRLNGAIKAIVQHHDRDPYTILNGRLARWKWNALYRAWKNIQIFNGVDCHVSVSKVVEDNLLSFPNPGKYESYKPYIEALRLLRTLPVIHPKKSLVLYNGVDTRMFYPKKGLRNNAIFKVGCIGNFQELKGQITLIKAGERLIKERGMLNLRLSFIGSGETLSQCKTYVAKNRLDDYVAFENEVHHRELNDYYNTLDLFVLPSYYEGFGCVFTEASACGVPFMLCEHQGASEYISPQESDKWLFRPHDDKMLSGLIYQYYLNRVKQNLRYSYDIDVLIASYLNEIS